jgi:hypothetical protein
MHHCRRIDCSFGELVNGKVNAAKSSLAVRPGLRKANLAPLARRLVISRLRCNYNWFSLRFGHFAAQTA